MNIPYLHLLYCNQYTFCKVQLGFVLHLVGGEYYIFKLVLFSGTECFSPSIVIDGVNLPLLPNSDSPSGLANSSLGFGSQRLPSTRDHTPMEQFQPMMLYRMQQ